MRCRQDRPFALHFGGDLRSPFPLFVAESGRQTQQSWLEGSGGKEEKCVKSRSALFLHTSTSFSLPLLSNLGPPTKMCAPLSSRSFRIELTAHRRLHIFLLPLLLLSIAVSVCCHFLSEGHLPTKRVLLQLPVCSSPLYFCLPLPSSQLPISHFCFRFIFSTPPPPLPPPPPPFFFFLLSLPPPPLISLPPFPLLSLFLP
eukprot:RCo011833